MANETTAPVQANAAMLTKISLSDFNPKAIHAQPDTVRKLTLGTIIGIANGIKTGKMPDGVTPYEGMKGNFEIQYADGKRVASGVAYLPDAFMQPILDQLSDEYGTDPEDPTKEILVRKAVASVRFALLVDVIRAENPAGYSWQVTPIGQVTANDPLSELRGLANGGDVQKLLASDKAAEIEGSGKKPAEKAPAETAKA
jgi:hypothetical protein